MRRPFKRIRKGRITKEELIADVIFLSVSAFICFLLVFLFDIHHSFYHWPIKIEFIFTNPYPYLIFVPAGTFAGFFVIKLLLFGLKEEEISS
jgi:hypothetical protein